MNAVLGLSGIVLRGTKTVQNSEGNKMTKTLSLTGKRVQIAGSISAETSYDVAKYGHEVVQKVVLGVLEAGGGIVTTAGKEPRLKDGEALVFAWSVLEVIADSIRHGIFPQPIGGRCPIVIVLSEKGEKEIPAARRALWAELLESGKVEVTGIMPGAHSATMIRERQFINGDILFILGGGTGVEHLAKKYLSACKPVIPLDLPLGGSRGDGLGGAEQLARKSRTNPKAFIRLQKVESGKESAMLAQIATSGGRAGVSAVADAVLRIIVNLEPPTVFYVRLLNSEHKDYVRVERFFRNVVDPVSEEHGLVRVDLGRDEVMSGFLNAEIFSRLHHSTVAVVDVTGDRPNCFIELGYALGRQLRVICTAESGTILPFDQSAIPCHFWKDSELDEARKKDLRAFWSQYIGRAPLVP